MSTLLTCFVLFFVTSIHEIDGAASPASPENYKHLSSKDFCTAATGMRFEFSEDASPDVAVRPRYESFEGTGCCLFGEMEAAAEEDDLSQGLSTDTESSTPFREESEPRDISESPRTTTIWNTIAASTQKSPEIKEVRDNFYLFLLDIERRKTLIDEGKAEMISPEEMQEYFLRYMKTFKQTILEDGTLVLYDEALIDSWKRNKKGDLSPIGKDYKSMHVHHLARTPDSALALLPASLHVHRALPLIKKNLQKTLSKRDKSKTIKQIRADMKTKKTTPGEDIFFSILHPEFDVHMKRPASQVQRGSKWRRLRRNVINRIHSVAGSQTEIEATS